LPFVATVPRWTLVRLLESRTVNESVVEFVKRSFTAVLVPSQPLSTDAGSMASEKLKVAVSPASILPAVPPVLFAALTLETAGLVVSTVKVLAELVPVLPAVSVCVAWAV
jgi:hypothetical protein